MTEGLNELKMRILISLLAMKEHGSTVTHLSKVFNVSKSTISRACDKLIGIGLLQHMGKSTRGVELTAYGAKTAADYERRCSTAERWLTVQGVSKRVAKQDAILLALALSEHTAEALERRVKQLSLKESLTGRRYVTGESLCGAFGDGRYPFAYVFHRCHAQRSHTSLISMANEGFESSGELVVENGRGIVALTARTVEHTSALGGISVSGSLRALRYYDDDKLHDARKEGNRFFFPIDIVEFLNVSGVQHLQGSAVLRMSCSAGEKHMPESDAIFTMFI